MTTGLYIFGLACAILFGWQACLAYSAARRHHATVTHLDDKRVGDPDDWNL